MLKCCFTLKSLLKNTSPMKKRSMVKVTESYFCIAFHASSISSLQWMSSKIKIELFVALPRKKLKYSNVAALRWLPSIKSKSTFSIISLFAEIVLLKSPSTSLMFFEPVFSKFSKAISPIFFAPSKVIIFESGSAAAR